MTLGPVKKTHTSQLADVPAEDLFYEVDACRRVASVWTEYISKSTLSKPEFIPASRRADYAQKAQAGGTAKRIDRHVNHGNWIVVEDPPNPKAR